MTNKHKDTTIKRRARRGKRLDRNHLSTHFPKIANQWHPTKNGDLTADQVSYGSNKKCWWLCSICGHEWEAIVACRSNWQICAPITSGCAQCKAKYGQFPDSEYWKPWQVLCEKIARLIFPDFHVHLQYRLDNFQPDIVIMNDDGKIVLTIDAKTFGAKNSIMKDILNYSHYSLYLEFWCLRGYIKDIINPKNDTQNISVRLFDSHQLTMRINDLQVRTIIADRIQVVQREAQEYLARCKQEVIKSTLPSNQTILNL